MLEKQINTIKLKSLDELRQLETMDHLDGTKCVIIDARQIHESNTLSEEQKQAIKDQLIQMNQIVTLVCMSEDSFFSMECKPYVDMMYLTVGEESEKRNEAERDVNGFIEGEDLAVIEERLHELTDGRQLEHLQEIKQLFLKLRSNDRLERQDLKMEESCLFCKLACKKEGTEDESRI